jgi:hypothetical protein
MIKRYKTPIHELAETLMEAGLPTSVALEANNDVSKSVVSYILKIGSDIFVAPKDYQVENIIKTQGDFSKFDNYDLMTSAIMELTRLNNNSQSIKIPTMAYIMDIFNFLNEKKAVSTFSQGFRDDNLIVKHTYVGMVSTLLIAISISIAEFVTAITPKSPNAITHLVVKQASTKDIMRNGVLSQIKYISENIRTGRLLSDLNNVLKHPALTESLTVISAVLATVSLVVFLIRFFIRMILRVRNNTATYLKQQASFVEMNAARINSVNKEIADKQLGYANKLTMLSEKISLDYKSTTVEIEQDMKDDKSSIKEMQPTSNSLNFG